MKNNNAIISDIIQALEGDQLVLLAIDGQLCKFATARTKRQDAKRAFAANGHVVLSFGHLRWAGDFHITLRDIPGEGIVVIRNNLPGEASETVFGILDRQSPKDKIEVESEILAGCRLLGARYHGEGKFTTPCGVTFHVPLDKPVKAQEVRDAVICDLSWNIKKKPQIFLTRPIPTPQ
jgi:hypothetical protein